MNRLLLLILVSITPLFAQSDTPTRKIDCRFISISERSDLSSILNIATEDLEIACKVKRLKLDRERTECIAVNDVLTFVTAGDKKPLAKVRIPPSVDDAILIFVPDPSKEAKLPYRIFPIDDSDKNFPSAGASVVNFYGSQVRFIIGENKGLLEPFKSTGIKRPEKRDDFNMALVGVQFKNNQGSWQTVRETKVRFIPGLRYLVFTYVDPSSKRPTVKTVKDFLEPPQADQS
ncbi:MAG: hypothetical protein AAGC74_06075 [Verrucomicrobiota bacterium]